MQITNVHLYLNAFNLSGDHFILNFTRSHTGESGQWSNLNASTIVVLATYPIYVCHILGFPCTHTVVQRVFYTGKSLVLCGGCPFRQKLNLLHNSPNEWCFFDETAKLWLSFFISCHFFNTAGVLCGGFTLCELFQLLWVCTNVIVLNK